MEIYIAHISTTTYPKDENSEEHVKYENKMVAFDSWPKYGDLIEYVMVPSDLNRNELISEDGMNISNSNYNLHVNMMKTNLISLSVEE